eukprot:TRINITY_DN17309_c0_g1_i1.p1 TRINITY_DN17309_c0_g1~~TRINITY_DN17309_c0_g1_i1.p1  ORF type:complete len:628 (-),score=95.45 TRINITY_DN17309_c0_g1_i1:36-1751(-)
MNNYNRDLIIENLREIAELLVWGDKHDAKFFEFFLEKNIFVHFLNFLKKKTDDEKLSIQLIQTLSMLVENINSKTSLYYLFSKNHMNSLISHDFDFKNEELLAHYISFLKTLSLKLDQSTIHFFLNDQLFPFFSEATHYFNHEEPMIRISVRTITLNIFRVDDKVLHAYLAKESPIYFKKMVAYLRKVCYRLDNAIIGETEQESTSLNFLEEIQTIFEYLNEIFLLQNPILNKALLDNLLPKLLLDLFVESLVSSDEKHQSKINTTLALYMLTEVFHIFHFQPLVHDLSCALLHTFAKINLSLSDYRLPTHLQNDKKSFTPYIEFHEKRNPFRDLFVSTLLSPTKVGATQNDQHICLCAVLGILRNSCKIESSLYQESHLFPPRLPHIQDDGESEIISVLFEMLENSHMYNIDTIQIAGAILQILFNPSIIDPAPFLQKYKSKFITGALASLSRLRRGWRESGDSFITLSAHYLKGGRKGFPIDDVISRLSPSQKAQGKKSEDVKSAIRRSIQEFSVFLHLSHILNISIPPLSYDSSFGEEATHDVWNKVINEFIHSFNKKHFAVGSAQKL